MYEMAEARTDTNQLGFSLSHQTLNELTEIIAECELLLPATGSGPAQP